MADRVGEGLREAELALTAVQEAFDRLAIAITRAQGAVEEARRDHTAAELRRARDEAAPEGGWGTWDRIPLGAHADPPRGHYRRWYAVLAPVLSQGVYHDYQSYADSVRDLDQPWTGRGNIPFVQGSRSQAFNSRLEAVGWYVTETREQPQYRY